MSNRTIPFVFVLLLLLNIILSACSGSKAQLFVPLPPPAGAKYVLNINQTTVGGTAQIMSVGSAQIQIDYRENGSGPGKLATEIIDVQDRRGTMTQFTWGDWEKASLTINDYFSDQQEPTRAMLTLEFEEASIIQLFTGKARYTVDRSSLTFLYEPIGDGEWPRLQRVVYTELWGGKNFLLFGSVSVWEKDVTTLFPQFVQWGFWEQSATPADAVKDALQTAARQLANHDPDYQAVDTDTVRREFIGRQSGLNINTSGEPTGHISFEYKNAWGRQPNTSLIGDGALSEIEWQLGDDLYHMLVLSPNFSPIGSSLYLFTNETADVSALKESNPVQLYDDLRAGTLPGVFLAVYAGGDIGTMTSQVSGGEGGTVVVGDDGGVHYRILGDPTYGDVVLASNLLAMLGKAGQKPIGVYFAYAPGSGSGLVYYLAALQLVLANPDDVLRVAGIDASVIDTVHIPDLKLPPFVPVHREE